MTLSLWTIGGFVFAACTLLCHSENRKAASEAGLVGIVTLLVTCAGCCQ